MIRATGQRVLTAARWILGNHPDDANPEHVATHQDLAERALAGTMNTAACGPTPTAP